MRDQDYMQRAIYLAQKALGNVSPNPLVGCVIVKNNRIIGEGYHGRFGGPHAEIEALNKVKDKRELNGAEVYVTLEPCAHHGKTPPCAEKLSSLPISRVFIANLDPNPKVSGKGIEILKSSGIDISTGLLGTDAGFMNRRFLTNFYEHRPYIILKWAQSADGFIAKKGGEKVWISNPISRQLVHKWRAEEDAIAVGANTVINDDPELNVRDWFGKSPVPVIITDKDLPDHFKLKNNSQLQVFKLSEGKDDRSSIASVLDKLHQSSIGSVIIEGGAQLLNSFIQENLWDEARVFHSNTVLREGLKAPEFKAIPSYTLDISKNRLIYYYN